MKLIIKRLFNKRIFRVITYILLLWFIVNDLSRSFEQYSCHTFDGDVAESVLPYSHTQKTFDDPTGIKTIINNDKHVGTNRFFSHYFLHQTFRILPPLFQKSHDPIESVYLTTAIAKLFMQIMILYLLTVIIVGKMSPFSLKFIITAAIILAFFQTNGWGRWTLFIDIIFKSVSYSFFYPFPLIFILLYYLPVFFEFLHNKIIKMNVFLIILWAVFAIISCFSGPLNPPIILIINLILFCYLFYQSWQKNTDSAFYKKTLQTIRTIKRRHYLFIIPITIIALYSLFLGTYINAYESLQLPLKELYLLLPKGILKMFANIPYLIIFSILITNFIIISLKYKNDAYYRKITGLYHFLIAFSLLYILLLPFGGYRPYRPFLLRTDTNLPVLILLLFTSCYTIMFILKRLLNEKWSYFKIIYPTVILSVLILFLAHEEGVRELNYHEKTQLYIIADSEENVIALDTEWPVISWEFLSNPEDSRAYGELLYLWNITDTVKLWYNAPIQKKE